MKNNRGLTLIELLVVVVTVAILAAIAIPTYTSYMQRARRADAKTALEQVRAGQEMWRAENGSYSVLVAQLQNTMGVPPTAVTPYYNWSFTGTLNASSFTAQAVPNPNSSQKSDSGGTLYIDSTGSKWNIDKNGVRHNYPSDPSSAWAK